MKKKRINGTERAKMKVIHQFRPTGSLFVQKTIQKEACVAINLNIDKPCSSPTREAGSIANQNKFDTVPCRKQK